MRKQLQMQQDGINNMTIFEWLKNRENFKKYGRNPKSMKIKEDFRDRYRNAKIDEYLLLYEDMDIKAIEAMVDSELEGLAALHNPDEITGGYVDVVTQMGNKRIKFVHWVIMGSIEKVVLLILKMNC
ncbi:polymorphic toxin type 15 domain-containing protein, partial [Phocaeicola dorei]|nr:polymorphic toxin type 15 domain-containing protein [Phocaeicola dorei]